ncbi:MAG: HNH endonuclease [Methanogenium sp.]|jgi:hypothetical protein
MALHKRIETYADYCNKRIFKENPANINTLISSDQFFGSLTENGKTIYKVWKDELTQVMAEDIKYLVVLTGAIGVGKTSAAVLGIAAVMNKILCLKNPWQFFKKTAGGRMSIVFFNLTKSLSESKAYGTLQSYLVASPWFRKHGVVKGTVPNQWLDIPLFSYALASPNARGFGCLSADTKISLLDGRELTIPEIIKEREEGKQHWVYSYDIEKRKVVSGKVANALKTKLNTKTVKVKLDNDQFIVCTPDHPFLLRNGEYKEAQNLSFGDSLMPLYRRKGNGGYEQFFEVDEKCWCFTHRRMAGDIPQKFRNEKGQFKGGCVVHHRDFNKYNNNPDNLKYMTGKAHYKFHAMLAHKTLHTPEAREKSRMTCKEVMKRPEIKKKISDGLKASWTPERRKAQSLRQTNLNKTFFVVHNAKPDIKTRANQKRVEALKKFWLSEKGVEKRKEASIRSKAFNLAGHAKKMALLAQLPEAKKKQKESRKKWLETEAGKKWKAEQSLRMKTNNPNNHTVVAVEEDIMQDVYDLTIENYHNFATSAGVFVHNTQGLDVIIAIMDEVDAPDATTNQKQRVLKAYDNTVRRFESRFVYDSYGETESGVQLFKESLGKFFLVASKQEELSFLNTFITERKGSPNVHIVDIPFWAIKTGELSGRTFSVAIGDMYTPSNIIYLPAEKEKAILDGREVKDIPIEFLEPFTADIVGALRDIAGISVEGRRKSKFFPSEKIIQQCYDKTKQNPVTKPTIMIGLNDEIDLIHYLDLKKIRMPKSTRRFLHSDVAYASGGDCLSLAMSGVKTYKKQEVMNPDGTFSVRKMPVVETDFWLRLKAKPGDVIPLFAVRKLILDLRTLGFNIAKYTADLNLLSEDTKQLLTKRKIACDGLSLDRDLKPYTIFRELVIEQRWMGHFDPFFHFEAINLEKDPKTGKIDHPDKVTQIVFIEDGSSREAVMEGSKDVIDGVAGSVYGAIVDLGDESIDGDDRAAILRQVSKGDSSKKFVEEFWWIDQPKVINTSGVETYLLVDLQNYYWIYTRTADSEPNLNGPFSDKPLNLVPIKVDNPVSFHPGDKNAEAITEDSSDDQSVLKALREINRRA